MTQQAIKTVKPNLNPAIKTFDLTGLMMSLKGKDYLPVAARLYWLNEITAPPVAISRFVTEIELVKHEYRNQPVTNKEYLYVFMKCTLNIYGVDADGNEYLCKSVQDFGSETSLSFTEPEEKAACVPMSTQILTLEGWKHQSELVLGESVFAYNPETDKLELTELLATSVYENQDVYRLGNDHAFEAFCNLDHTWAVEARKFDRKIDGTLSAPTRSLLKTKDLSTTSKQTIVTAAQYEGGERYVEPDLAMLLGFAITDGGWKQPKPHHRPRLTIVQAKPHQVAILDRITVGHCSPKHIMNPAGKGKAKLDSYYWSFTADQTQALLDAFGLKTRSDLPKVIASLHPETRSALLQGIMLGDGSDRAVIGELASSDWLFDTIQILANLDGIACTKRKRSVDPKRTQPYDSIRLRKTNRVWVTNLAVTSVGKDTIWCPTTKFGTWVAKFESGMTTITGNTKALGRCLGQAGFGTLQAPEFDYEALPKNSVTISGAPKGIEGMAVVDSPVARRTPAQAITAAMAAPVTEQSKVTRVQSAIQIQPTQTHPAQAGGEVSQPAPQPATPLVNINMLSLEQIELKDQLVALIEEAKTDQPLYSQVSAIITAANKAAGVNRAAELPVDQFKSLISTVASLVRPNEPQTTINSTK
jgi:hypothetical protein